MKKYRVVNPVLVRNIPSAEGTIVNALNIGTTINVISEDSGWLYTESGNYIFKTDDIEKVNETEEERLIHIYNSMPTSLKAGFAKLHPMIFAAAANGDDDEEQSDSSDATPKPTITTGDDIQFKEGATYTNFDGKEVTLTGTMLDAVNGAGWKIDHTVGDGSETVVISHTRKGIFSDDVKTMTVKLSDIQIRATNGNGAWFNGDDSELVGGVSGNGGSYEDGSSGGGSGNKSEDTGMSEEMKKAIADATNRLYEEIINDIKGIEDWASQKLDNLFNGTKFTISNTRAVFGMPYQFSPITDIRLDTDANSGANSAYFGRLYYEKIVARAPVMIVQVGVPSFMFSFSKEQHDTILEKLTFGDGGKHDAAANSIVNGNGRYYSFKETGEQYFSAVNSMTRVIACLMGIEDKPIPTPSGGTKAAGKVNWAEQGMSQLWNWYHHSVCFYIDSQPQVQEDITNGTRQSQLASKVNQIGDMASEIQFLLGGISNLTGKDFTADQSSLGSSNTTGIISSISENIKALMAGGRMYFPEIWSDSNFMRQYSVSIKLDTPDADPLSVYLNIFVPLCHILAFCLPRSAGKNVYVSPFLIRAYYKSMFNIDMGIVTSCSITKGNQGSWTQDGLPTEVTVNLTIKDLYDVMSLAVFNNEGKVDSETVTTNNVDLVLANPGQIDYLANMCGINISEPNFGRYLKLMWLTYNPKLVIGDRLRGFGRAMISEVYNKWNNVFLSSSNTSGSL